MTAVSSVSPTGDPYVDGILTGVKWATGSLTFSFPTNASLYGSSYGSAEPTTNFKAFTTVQEAAVRSILQNYSAVANVKFTEVTESSTSSGDLRYAESDSPSTAWGYYPSTSAKGGDMWFNNSSHYYDSPVRGNYAWMTMQHETGHAMGLKHPQDTIGSFGTMPLDHDSVEYTVMSYRSYIGSGTSAYTIQNGSYPQSLMMLDIAALQDMYGANYTTQSGNTVYSWSPTTGQEYINGVSQGPLAANKIFLTIWDGGGNDTYDFSNYTTNLSVNLNPGAWTTVSTAQLANLGNGHYAAGNIANALLYQGNTASLIENAIGGSGADTIIGNAADNHLTGNGGNDLIDGAGGYNTAVYSGHSTDYKWSQNADGSWQITDLRAGSPDGTDTLKNIEQLQFGDGSTVALGTVTQPPPPTNSAPVITSAAPTISLTEWAAGSTQETQNAAHTASGTMTYSDANATDTHVASVVAEASGYVGTFTLGAANDTTDTVGWSFSVADSAIDYLNAGQSLTQKYDVTIDDGHGGTAMQTVTVVLNGANETTTTTTNTAPVITSAAPTVSLTEWAAGSTQEAQNVAHTASGTMSYSDPNATDVHVASFVAEASGYLGTFTVGTPNDTADTVGWSFQVADSAINYLNAGQSLTQKYDVTINDGHGGTAMQTVTIVLNGANETTTTTTTTKVHGNTSKGKETKPAHGNGSEPTTTTDSLSDQRDNAPAPSSQDQFHFGGATADTVPHIGLQALLLPETSAAPVHVPETLPHLLDMPDFHIIDTILHGNHII